MLLDPFKRFYLVLEPIVQASALLDLLSRKETIGTNTIIERYDYYIHPGGFDQTGTIVVGVGIRIISPSLNPEEDRQLGGLHICRSIDIQEEAVL